MTVWTVMFYGGIALMAAAAVGGAAAAVILHASGKRLKKRLEDEFGKKRR